jgi:hypothetical protein
MNSSIGFVWLFFAVLFSIISLIQHGPWYAPLLAFGPFLMLWAMYRLQAQKYFKLFRPLFTQPRESHLLNPKIFMQGFYKDRPIKLSYVMSNGKYGLFEPKVREEVTLSSRVSVSPDKVVGTENPNFAFPQVYKEFCFKDSDVFYEVNTDIKLKPERAQELLNDLILACEKAEAS